jgi:hypothetical protein
VFTVSWAWAQDMDKFAPAKKTPQSIPENLRKVLAEDQTDKNLYIPGKYYCHNFACTFYAQNSCVMSNLDNLDLKGIEKEWGVVIQRLNDKVKLPIYYVGLVNKESGFYHAINAMLVNPDKPNEISSYIFIEPQTDEVFMTARDLHQAYNRYYGSEPLSVSIQTFDAFKHNGNIYQSITNEVVKFEVRP